MANPSTVAQQRDRDFDDGVFDLPAKDRAPLKKLDTGRIPQTTRTKTKRATATATMSTRVARTPKAKRG